MGLVLALAFAIAGNDVAQAARRRYIPADAYILKRTSKTHAVAETKDVLSAETIALKAKITQLEQAKNSAERSANKNGRELYKERKAANQRIKRISLCTLITSAIIGCLLMTRGQPAPTPEPKVIDRIVVRVVERDCPPCPVAQPGEGSYFPTFTDCVGRCVVNPWNSQLV